ncbi:MAG: VC0807 family protein [Micropruina sp.]|uniref:VC0807 family protein n=1 Tax=Micropruina sp. TaxID=2737536 RepID=UPI0039E47F0D
MYTIDRRDTSATGCPSKATTKIEPPTARRPRRWRAALAADIGLPLISYYGLHAYGASDRTALIAATGAAGLRLLWEAVRHRHVTWFSAIMLAAFGAGAALSATGGDPRVLLLRDSVGTALIGVVFLLSLLGGTPLTLAATQHWRPDRAARITALYRDDPQVRRAFRVSTAGWGLGMLGESAVRVPLVFLLPVDVMVGLSTALMIATMAGLFIWNAVYITRAARRTPALDMLLPQHRGRRR